MSSAESTLTYKLSNPWLVVSEGSAPRLHTRTKHTPLHGIIDGL